MHIPLCPRHPVLFQQPLQQCRLLPSRLAHLSCVAAKGIQASSLLYRRRSSSGVGCFVRIKACCAAASAGGAAIAGPPGWAVEGAPQLGAQVLHLPLAGEEDEDAAGGQGAVDLADLQGEAGGNLTLFTAYKHSLQRRTQVGSARDMDVPLERAPARGSASRCVRTPLCPASCQPPARVACLLIRRPDVVVQLCALGEVHGDGVLPRRNAHKGRRHREQPLVLYKVVSSAGQGPGTGQGRAGRSA